MGWTERPHLEEKLRTRWKRCMWCSYEGQNKNQSSRLHNSHLQEAPTNAPFLPKTTSSYSPSPLSTLTPPGFMSLRLGIYLCQRPSSLPRSSPRMCLPCLRVPSIPMPNTHCASQAKSIILNLFSHLPENTSSCGAHTLGICICFIALF